MILLIQILLRFPQKKLSVMAQTFHHNLHLSSLPMFGFLLMNETLHHMIEAAAGRHLHL